MIESFIEAWYRLYQQPIDMESRSLVEKGPPDVLLKKVINRQSPGRTISITTTGCQYGIIDVLQQAIASNGLLDIVCDDTGLFHYEIEAAIHVAGAVVSAFDYDDIFAPIMRIYVTFLHNLNAGTLPSTSVQRKWSHFLNLTLSNTEAFQLANQLTKITYNAHRPQIILHGTEKSVINLYHLLSNSERVVTLLGRQSGITSACTVASLRAIASIMPSGEQIASKSLFNPNQIAHVWKTDINLFTKQIRAALDDYLVVPFYLADRMPAAQKSLRILDKNVPLKQKHVPPERKAAAEHFIDTSLISLINDCNDLDLLFEHFGADDPDRFQKLLTIMAHHLFVEKEILLQLGRSERLQKYPEGPWKKRVMTLLTLHEHAKS